ncbi:MAG: YigZ family protein [Lachnospiraceae bacterium]|nr:YigZ family protein [Lachnospiraceae bacterium]
MPEEYKTLLEGGVGEVTEKKSRFIATAMPVNSEEEAVLFIESIKKKYWDARHNCSAFVVGRNHELKRCSDDGEPSQTAGKPILDVLLAEDIHNAVIVVTRYFGGTLLGTGGLVRAYTKAAKEGLLNSKVITKHMGLCLTVDTDYNGIGKLQYLCGQMDITILDIQYTDRVGMELLVPWAQVGGLKKKIIEATSGKAGLIDGSQVWFGKVGNEIKVFDN